MEKFVGNDGWWLASVDGDLMVVKVYGNCIYDPIRRECTLVIDDNVQLIKRINLTDLLK